MKDYGVKIWPIRTVILWPVVKFGGTPMGRDEQRNSVIMHGSIHQSIYRATASGSAAAAAATSASAAVA